MTQKLKVLNLFSGIGGFSLGLERTGGFETVAFCEINPFARKILKKHWPEVRQYHDVTTAEFEGPVDLVTGGFPCQDISLAGEGAGLEGERSGLYWHILRTAGMVGFPKLLLENVAALLNRGLSSVLGSMAQIGYDAEWHCIPASYVGAPHGRDRIWIIADTGSQSMQSSQRRYLDRSLFHQIKRNKGADPFRGHPEWPSYCGPIIMDDGVPREVDASRALGNSVCAKIPEIIGHAILAAEAA